MACGHRSAPALGLPQISQACMSNWCMYGVWFVVMVSLFRVCGCLRWWSWIACHMSGLHMLASSWRGRAALPLIMRVEVFVSVGAHGCFREVDERELADSGSHG